MKELVSEDLLEFPALLLGDWLRFDDADFVANGGCAFFIVGVKLLGSFDDLFEAWVRHTVGVFHNDGLIHGSRDNDANTGLAETGCLGF